MPSPFPGMNPYLEQDALWNDFHLAFLPEVRARLVAQVRPAYIVLLEEHLYVHESPEGPRRLLGRGDVSLVGANPGGGRRPAAGVLEAPARVRLAAQDVERAPYLEVRDRTGRELVTVVELLSPSNKRGADREQYLTKRAELIRSPVHLVEIDLLRGGRPMPLEGRPGCDYSVLVSRAKLRPQADFWPIGLRDRLPVVPIPLRGDGEGARIDLQEVLHSVYDASGYEDFVYQGDPQPALSQEDAAWARGLVARLP